MCQTIRIYLKVLQSFRKTILMKTIMRTFYHMHIDILLPRTFLVWSQINCPPSSQSDIKVYHPLCQIAKIHLHFSISLYFLFSRHWQTHFRILQTRLYQRSRPFGSELLAHLLLLYSTPGPASQYDIMSSPAPWAEGACSQHIEALI